MPDTKMSLDNTIMRRRAFARWENEGGATATGSEKHPVKTPHPYTVVYKKKLNFTHT